jgi:hypothetical protein
VVTNLGALEHYYPVKKLNRVGNLVLFFIFIAGSLLVFLYGLYVTFMAYQKHGLAVVDNMLLVPMILFIVLLLSGLATGTLAYGYWNKGVTVYAQGLAIRDRSGLQTWRWEEIVSLTAAITRHHIVGIYTGTSHVYSLYNRHNQRMELTDITIRVEELAKTIQDSIFPILYDRAAQRFNAGKKLVFGRVVITRAGIQIKKKTFPWAEVQQVSIQRGILKVSKKEGGWFSGASVPASAIPNLNVLLTFIHQTVGLKVG